jgi:hypothetical protein
MPGGDLVVSAFCDFIAVKQLGADIGVLGQWAFGFGLGVMAKHRGVAVITVIDVAANVARDPLLQSISAISGNATELA